MSDENDSWAEGFNALRADLDSSVESLHQLIALVREHFGGRVDPEIQSSFGRIVELLDRSRGRSQELLGRFVNGPLLGFLMGHALTREQYYLTLAAGLHSYTAKGA